MATRITALPPPERRRWGRPAARVLARLVVGACLLTALVTTAVPAAVHLSGRQLLVVISGSMTPTFRVGDAVLVSHPTESELRPGMVVSFHAPGSPEELTTHRIHSLRPMRGGLFVQTKGDANPAPDPDFTPAGSVVGVMGASVSHLGYVLAFAQSPLGKAVVLGLPLVAFLLGQLALVAHALRGSARRRSSRATTLVLLVAALAIGGGVASSCLTGAFLTARASAAGNTFATRASICASASGYGARVLQDSPAIYYRFGETSGTTAQDKSTNARNGTYQGAPALNAPGAIRCDGANGGVGLNGTSQWVSNATSFANPQTFSVEAWFDTTTGAGKLVGFGTSATGTSSAYDRHLYLTASGQLVFGVYSGATKVVTSGTATYLDDQWHHVVGTFSPSTGLRLYVDGVLLASDASVTAAESQTGYWHVGFDNVDGWPNASGRYFKGTLDDVAIYTSVLSATTVKAHYDANSS